MAENFREPQSANEALLQNLLGAQNETREPQSVTEYYLQKILEQGSGGNKLYSHNFRMYNRPNAAKIDATFQIINNSSANMTLPEIASYISDNFKNDARMGANGYFINNDEEVQIIYVARNTNTSLRFTGYSSSSGGLTAKSYNVTADCYLIESIIEL